MDILFIPQVLVEARLSCWPLPIYLSIQLNDLKVTVEALKKIPGLNKIKIDENTSLGNSYSVDAQFRGIQAAVERPHHNLLYVHGWLIPKPGVLHVLMEKADSDVTTALQQGVPLKSRMKIALDVINGLTVIHSLHCIHQDIKTESILVC